MRPGAKKRSSSSRGETKAIRGFYGGEDRERSVTTLPICPPDG